MFVMKKNLIKLTILSSVFAVGLGMVVVSASNKTASPLEATQHTSNYENYYYGGTYYNSLDTTDDGMNGNFRKALTNLIHPSSVYTYSGSKEGTLGRVLQDADEDPNNSSNMIMFYTRDSVTKAASSNSTWNREHVWPQSNSNDNYGTERAGADLLHIRPTYSTTNSQRGSLLMGDTNKTGALNYNGMLYGYKSSGKFEPIDSVKGDVARIFMYVWVAYRNEYSSKPMNMLDTIESYNTLLKWHTMDQPDELEGHRNNYAQNSKQGNRNPFVDHPEYAWKIFGEQCSDSVVQDCQAAYPGDGSSAKKVERIAVSGEATKKTYYVGESFDPAGLTITVYYDDNTSRTVGGSSCSWTPNPLTEGTTSVTCTYSRATATYSGITVIKRVSPATEGSVFSIEFNENSGDSGERLDGFGVLEEAKENTLVKSATAADSDNVFAGAYGLKLGTGSKSGSVSFTFKDEASVDIQKIEIKSTKYGSDSSTFSVKLGATTFVETGTPGTDYVQNLNDVAASTLTIATDQKRMYINKIIVTIKAEEVPPTPGPGDSSSNNPDPTGNTSASSETSEQTQPDGKKKAGCSGSIIATASLTSFTALIGLVFVFSKKRK